MNAPTLEHERTYLATVIALPELLDTHRVQPDDMSRPEHRQMLTGLMSARAAGRVTPRSIAVEAQRAGLVDVTRFMSELASVDAEPDLEPVVARIRELALTRRMQADSRALDAALAKGDMHAVRGALGKLGMATRSDDEGRVLTFRELCAHTLTEIQAAASSSGKLVRLGTPTVDAAFQIGPGQMLCVGAQTNVGKTSLVWAWLMSMAQRGIPCGMVSVEDREEDLGAKALGEIAGVNPAKLWQGATTADWDAVREALKRDYEMPITTAWVGTRDLDAVLARMEYMARVHGARVIVVDYLQAIAHRPGKDTRERTNQTLAELIAQAGRLGVGLVLCSQLARPDRGNPFKEPHLIDLKESGDIENRAQCVVLLWRKNDQLGPTLAKVAKAKRQPAGRRFTLGRHRDHAGLVELDALGDGEGFDNGDDSPDAYRKSLRGAR